MPHSRNKGKRGELEIAHLFGTRRTGLMQSQQGATEADVEHDRYHLEVKRQERIQIEAWCRQAEEDCPEGKIPVVVWRRNREPWRVTLLLDDFLKENV